MGLGFMKILSNLKPIMAQDNLFGRCIRGSGTLTLGSLVENVLRFIRNMVLARLLAPEAFGLMGTVVAAASVIEAMAEVGLSQAVIQHKEGADEQFLNLIWWLALLRATVLYIIAYILTPWIAGFYDLPDSVTLLRTGFLIIPLNGLVSPRIHVLQKEMHFKKWVIIMQSPGVIGITIGVISAYFLRNVWALVLAYLTEAFLRWIFSFIFYFFKPRFQFYRRYARDIMGFSRGMFGLPILMMLFAQADIFVIGKILSLHVLGMYVLARSLSEIPTTFVAKAVNPVILPAFSQIQEDKERLRRVLLAANSVAATFGLPFTAYLVLFSAPILSVVYGAGYGAVAVPFSVLCGFSLIFICSSLIVSMLLAIGRPSLHRTAAAVRAGLFLLFIYPATRTFGLVGASLAILASMLVALAIQMIYTRKLIDLGLSTYLNTFLPGLRLSLVVLVPGVLLRGFVGDHGIVCMLIGALFCLAALGLGVVKIDLFRQPRLYEV